MFAVCWLDEGTLNWPRMKILICLLLTRCHFHGLNRSFSNHFSMCWVLDMFWLVGGTLPPWTWSLTPLDLRPPLPPSLKQRGAPKDTCLLSVFHSKTPFWSMTVSLTFIWWYDSQSHHSPSLPLPVRDLPTLKAGFGAICLPPGLWDADIGAPHPVRYNVAEQQTNQHKKVFSDIALGTFR